MKRLPKAFLVWLCLLIIIGCFAQPPVKKKAEGIRSTLKPVPENQKQPLKKDALNSIFSAPQYAVLTEIRKKEKVITFVLDGYEFGFDRGLFVTFTADLALQVERLILQKQKDGLLLVPYKKILILTGDNVVLPGESTARRPIHLFVDGGSEKPEGYIVDNQSGRLIYIS